MIRMVGIVVKLNKSREGLHSGEEKCSVGIPGASGQQITKEYRRKEKEEQGNSICALGCP